MFRSRSDLGEIDELRDCVPPETESDEGVVEVEPRGRESDESLREEIEERKDCEEVNAEQ